MIRFNMFFLILVNFLVPLYRLNAQWQQTNGPCGDRIDCLAVNSTTVYAGSGLLGGGIFRSRNNGLNWTPVNNGLDLPNSVYQIAANGVNLIAGTWNGVYFSANDGEKWEKIDHDFEGSVLDVSITNSNFYAATPNHLWLSTNYGKNWQFIDKGIDFNNFSIEKIAVLDSNIFIGTRGNGLYKSSDNGNVWEKLENGLPTNSIVESIIKKNSNIFVGTINHGVFKSTNNGLSWAPLNIMGLSDLGVNGLGFIDTELYAATSLGVLVSKDDGLTWTVVNNGLKEIAVNCLTTIGQYIIVGTLTRGIYLSSDHGKTWNQSNNGLVNTIITALATDDKNLLAGTDGHGVFLSTNNEITWNQINSGIPEPVMVLNQYGTPISSATIVILSLLASSSSIFTSTYYSGSFLSVNNGENWTAISNGLPGLVNVFVEYNSDIYAGTSNGVYISKDKGLSWNIIGNNFHKNVKALIVENSIMVAGTDSSGIYLSTDEGKNWAEANEGLTYKEINVLSANGSYIFAGTWWGGAFRSADKGKTWIAINNGLHWEFGVFAFAIEGQNIFAGTSDEGVFLSTDNGDNWISVNGGLTNKRISSLLIYNHYLVAGTEGDGVFVRPLSEITSIIQDKLKIPNQFLLKQNYPNPFNPLTTIGFSIPFSEYVKLSVYDILGREVANLINEQKQAGNYEVKFDGSNLPSGVYFFRIQAGDFTQTKKMILMK